MTIKKLIEELMKHDLHAQVYIASDEEHNEVYKEIDFQVGEFEKSNNDGKFDALVLSGLSGSEVFDL